MRQDAGNLFCQAHVTQDVTHHWTATAFAKSVVFKYLSLRFSLAIREPPSPLALYIALKDNAQGIKQLQAPQKSSFLESLFLIYKNEVDRYSSSDILWSRNTHISNQ